MKIDMSLLRTYHYISARKLTQLGNQIKPSGWSKLAGKITGFYVSAGDVKVGMEMRQDPDPDPDPDPDANTLLALRKVVGKLLKQERIGTLDEDMPFVYGTIDMYHQVFKPHMEDRMPDERVYVTIGATDRTIVALGGSVRGLGATGSEGSRETRTRYPFFLEQDVLPQMMETEERPAKPRRLADPSEYVADMYRNWSSFSRGERVNPGKIKYEVLAVREHLRPVGRPLDVAVLIGSPVFLALA